MPRDAPGLLVPLVAGCLDNAVPPSERKNLVTPRGESSAWGIWMIEIEVFLGGRSGIFNINIYIFILKKTHSRHIGIWRKTLSVRTCWSSISEYKGLDFLIWDYAFRCSQVTFPNSSLCSVQMGCARYASWRFQCRNVQTKEEWNDVCSAKKSKILLNCVLVVSGQLVAWATSLRGECQWAVLSAWGMDCQLCGLLRSQRDGSDDYRGDSKLFSAKAGF